VGSIIPDPTPFDGTNRTKTVLPNTRTVNNINLTTRYVLYPETNQRLMLTDSIAQLCLRQTSTTA